MKLQLILFKGKALQQYYYSGLFKEGHLILSFKIFRIKHIRDEKSEVPADFSNEMNKWSLETIACIALETRLGVLKDLEKDSNPQRFIETIHDFFSLSMEVELMPPIWKFYKTKKFLKLMDTLNTMTKYYFVK